MEIHPVLELIRRRLQDGSLPQNRTDRAKLGLAVEGGGMRGVVSAGMLMGLADLGLKPVFDAVFGTSAGAINGAYFIAFRRSRGIGLYKEINNNGFIRLNRLFTSKPVLDLDYLMSRLISGPEALDYKAVIESPQEFRAVASSIERLRAVALGGFNTGEELVRGLRASTAIPFLTKGPQEFKEDMFLDGSLLEAIPYRSAIKNGCTHVLVLLSKPVRRGSRPDMILKRRLAGACLDTLHPGLGTAYRTRARHCGEEMLALKQASRQMKEPPFIYVVDPPPETDKFGRLEKNLSKLISGASLGRLALKNQLQDVINGLDSRPFRKP